MKRRRDPLDDFTVLNRKPTKKEQKMMSERICVEKEARAKNPSSIDFFINSGKPTEEDFNKISAHIRLLKAKNEKSAAIKSPGKKPKLSKVI